MSDFLTFVLTTGFTLVVIFYWAPNVWDFFLTANHTTHKYRHNRQSLGLYPLHVFITQSLLSIFMIVMLFLIGNRLFYYFYYLSIAAYTLNYPALVSTAAFIIFAIKLKIVLVIIYYIYVALLACLLFLTTFVQMPFPAYIVNGVNSIFFWLFSIFFSVVIVGIVFVFGQYINPLCFPLCLNLLPNAFSVLNNILLHAIIYVITTPNIIFIIIFVQLIAVIRYTLYEVYENRNRR